MDNIYVEGELPDNCKTCPYSDFNECRLTDCDLKKDEERRNKIYEILKSEKTNVAITRWFIENDQIQYCINNGNKREIGNYAVCLILNDYENENTKLKQLLAEERKRVVQEIRDLGC